MVRKVVGLSSSFPLPPTPNSCESSWQPGVQFVRYFKREINVLLIEITDYCSPEVLELIQAFPLDDKINTFTLTASFDSFCYFCFMYMFFKKRLYCPELSFQSPFFFYTIMSNKVTERTWWDRGAKWGGKSKWKQNLRLMNALKAFCSNHGNTDGWTYPEERGRHESCSQTRVWKDMLVPTSFRVLSASWWICHFRRSFS